MTRPGKLLRPWLRGKCVETLCGGLKISERRSCKALGQHRSSQRHQPQVRGDEDALTTAKVALAIKFGRYGYRRITELLRMSGLVRASLVSPSDA
jgi:putative transposase